MLYELLPVASAFSGMFLTFTGSVITGISSGALIALFIDWNFLMSVFRILAAGVLKLYLTWKAGMDFHTEFRPSIILLEINTEAATSPLRNIERNVTIVGWLGRAWSAIYMPWEQHGRIVSALALTFDYKQRDAIAPDAQRGPRGNLADKYVNRTQSWDADTCMLLGEEMLCRPNLRCGERQQDPGFTGCYVSDLSTRHANECLCWLVCRSECVCALADFVAGKLLGLRGSPGVERPVTPWRKRWPTPKATSCRSSQLEARRRAALRRRVSHGVPIYHPQAHISIARAKPTPHWLPCKFVHVSRQSREHRCEEGPILVERTPDRRRLGYFVPRSARTPSHGAMPFAAPSRTADRPLR
ncbi:hypothetical protein SVAN01_01146 [Stagonosporopsis vannaccii]|nr:hypothetical protein SVAN01_01146 [Stagonosporopsis vannaccii]